MHDCYVKVRKGFLQPEHNFLFYNLRHRKNIYLICI